MKIFAHAAQWVALIVFGVIIAIFAFFLDIAQLIEKIARKRPIKTTQTSETIWHKCDNPLFWRRTVDGDLTDHVGQTWRRKRPDGKWEYRQDEETFDDWSRRQW